MTTTEYLICESCNTERHIDDIVITDPINECCFCRDAEAQKWNRAWVAAGMPGTVANIGQTFDCTGDETCPDPDAQFGHITTCPFAQIDDFEV